MNPDKDLFTLIIELIEKVIGHSISPLSEKALAVFFILAIIALAANALILGIKTLIVEIIIPVFYNKEQKRRRARRRMFADHIEAEIRYLNSRESWNDNRFAELEAEVEAEGSRKIFGWIKTNFGGGSKIRRERSLSSAIKNSAVPLVLVEGDPGSGKSVALRHVAQQMARKASESRNVKSTIPLYINLKNLKRGTDEIVDRNFINDFVHKTINRINDRDIDEFLKDEFQIGIEDGTWFFLFDSFDEIPEILSSTESDKTIRLYAEAIRDFLHGMNKCKGIVASREYKGPRYLGWPKFRIVPLSNTRRSELIKRANLPTTAQNGMYAGISFASAEFRAMTSNPMFLSLLCEYMQKKNVEFPLYTHVVYEEYIWKRLTRDEDRLRARFDKTPLEVREAAEKLAFCMTADIGLGLSPSIESLKTSSEKLKLNLGDDFDSYIESLEYLKLARIEIHIEEGKKFFTFAHRRFQEYFATAIVVKEPSRISPKELLLNAQWRETAVTLLQTQGIDQLKDMLTTAEKIFSESLEQMSDEFDLFEIEPDIPEEKGNFFQGLGLGIGLLIRHIFEDKQETAKWLDDIVNEFEKKESEKKTKKEKIESYDNPITWPKGLYHLLSILQDGRFGKANFLPLTFQHLIDKFLRFTSDTGSLDDRKMAIEVAGISSKESFIHILKAGFQSTGSWIKSYSYRQLARLGDVPPEFAKFIKAMLVTMMFNGKLFFEREEIYAQLARLDKSRHYINTARLLAWSPIIDHLLVGLSLALIVSYVNLTPSVYGFALMILIYLALRWYSKPLWEQGFNFSQNEYYARWFDTPHFMAALIVLIGFLVWLMLQLNMNNIGTTHNSNQPGSPSSISPDTIFQIMFLLLLCSLNFWSSIASVEAFSGKRTHPLWWLLFLAYPLFVVPIVAALELLAVVLILGDLIFVIYRLPVFYFIFKKHPAVKGSALAFYLLSKFDSLIFVISAIILSAVLFPLIKIVDSKGFLGLFFTVVIIMVSALVVLVLINLFINILKNNLELRRYQKSRLADSPIKVLNFLEYLGNFKQKSIRIIIIRDAINRHLIASEAESEMLLRKLITFVQALIIENNKKHYEYLMKQDSQLALSLGIKETDKIPRKTVWNSEQLDELCHLLDQIQSSNIGN